MDAVHLGEFHGDDKTVERWTSSRQRRQLHDGGSRGHCAEGHPGAEAPSGLAQVPRCQVGVHAQVGEDNSQWSPSTHVPLHGPHGQHRGVQECSFVRAVSESPTALDAVARWSPTTTPPKKTKRLTHQPKHTGSRGKGGFRGKKRGGGSS